MANRFKSYTYNFSFLLLGLLGLAACESDTSGTIGKQDAAPGGRLEVGADTFVKADAAGDGAVAVDGAVADASVDASDGCGVCSPNAHCLAGQDAAAATTDAGGICECNAGYEGDGMQCAAVAVTLTGLRWELPCGLSTSANVCSVAAFTTKTKSLGGIAGAQYALQLRFRGVVEQKTYTDGQADGYWYIGGTPNSDAYNVYKLQVSSPPQTFFLNAGTSNVQRSWPLDFVRNVKVNAGAILTLSADAVDGAEIKNIDNTQAGVPLIILGVTPAPAAYNGQFIQMDVVSVTRALNP